MELYPTIGIDRANLKHWNECRYYSSPFFHPKKIYKAKWNKATTRREFFEAYAKENGFDPLIANNWYSIPKETIMAVKVCLLFRD
jgi:hypothetical protein